MKSNLIALLLVLIITATIAGFLALGENEGLINVSTPLRLLAGRVPWAGQYVAPSTSPPAAELAELERIKAEETREEQWSELKKTESDLKKAEDELNTERQRLAQWEDELERREAAFTERQQEYEDREKQYELAVKYYRSMKPVTAAKILAQQEDLLVIELFRRMPERSVAAILAEMDPAVAGTIMRKMAR